MFLSRRFFYSIGRGTEENLENVNYDIPLFETIFLFQTPILIGPAKVETHEERCRTGCGILEEEVGERGGNDDRELVGDAIRGGAIRCRG